MESKVSNTSFDFAGLLRIIIKWKKQLVIVFFTAAIISVIFTRPFFMPDYFESSTIVYPSNIIPFSLESPTETMLQLLQSDEIKDNLTKDFNLYQHYGVDPKSATHRKELFEYLNNNISISRTAYESVNITVADQNPHTAALMCDSIVSYLNNFVRIRQKEKTSEVSKIFRDELVRKKTELDSLERVLQSLATDYGIIEFKSQTKELTKAHFRGNSPQVNQMYENFRQRGLEANSISEHLWRMRGYYNDVKDKYDEAVKDETKILTYSTLVTKAMPSEAKSFPHRTIIIAIFSLSVLFFSVLLIFWIENFRKNIQPRLQQND